MLYIVCCIHRITYMYDMNLYRLFLKVWKFVPYCTRRCDKLLFMSTQADDKIGSIAIPNITNGRASLWNKTKKVIGDKRDTFGFFVTTPGICLRMGAPQRRGRLVHQSRRRHLCHFGKPQVGICFLTALSVARDLLRNYNSETPIHFGHRFKYLGVGHHRFYFTKIFQCARDIWQEDQDMSFQR